MIAFIVISAIFVIGIYTFGVYYWGRGDGIRWCNQKARDVLGGQLKDYAQVYLCGGCLGRGYTPAGKTRDGATIKLDCHWCNTKGEHTHRHLALKSGGRPWIKDESNGPSQDHSCRDSV